MCPYATKLLRAWRLALPGRRRPYAVRLQAGETPALHKLQAKRPSLPAVVLPERQTKEGASKEKYVDILPATDKKTKTVK